MLIVYCNKLIFSKKGIIMNKVEKDYKEFLEMMNKFIKLNKLEIIFAHFYKREDFDKKRHLEVLKILGK